MLSRVLHTNKFPVYKIISNEGSNEDSKTYENINKTPHEEYQYLNLISDVLDYGSLEKGRNGFTKSVFGSVMQFDLTDNKIPILTTKKVAWKTCLKELLWFISGNTDNRVLQQQKVTIWNDNSSRDFLDTVGLVNYKENDLGPIYGFQWRHFNAEYRDYETDYTGKGIDQLQKVINVLKSTDPQDRNSRRLIISAWNPCQLGEMALPPCHVLIQFNVSNDGRDLHCSLYQRSGDIGLGVPFNIASYSFLTHLIAHHCGLRAKEFVYYLGNAHIYDDHFKQLREQLKNEPYKFPIIDIKEKRENIDDYVFEDFQINDYKHHDTIKMTMRA